jgi:hypothetical protein
VLESDRSAIENHPMKHAEIWNTPIQFSMNHIDSRILQWPMGIADKMEEFAGTNPKIFNVICHVTGSLMPIESSTPQGRCIISY